MSEDAIDKVAHRLNRYEKLVTFGLGFIVLFAVTLTLAVSWTTFRAGQTAQQIQEVSEENHRTLCALRRESFIRYRIFHVSSVGLIPEVVRKPLEKSYAASIASFRGLDCTGE